MDHAAALDSALGDRYVSEFFGLRPEVLLTLYVERGLWERFLARAALGGLGRPGAETRDGHTSRHCERTLAVALWPIAERAMTPPELALVVPCYNEAARLDPEAFLHFVTTHPGVQLVLVDDGSSGRHWEILERIRAAAPAAVTTLRHSPNRGKAEAVRAGILAGLAQRAGSSGSSTPTSRPRCGRSTTSWPCSATARPSSSSWARG